MSTQRPVWVVVPAYEEEGLIGATLAGIPGWVDRIVVVDDGSRDGTSAAIRRCRDGRVLALRHDMNRGVGAAIATGYARFLEEEGPGSQAVCVVMAGDGQMDPRDLAALLAPVLEGRAGYAKGNRLRWPGTKEVMPRIRWWGNRILSAMTRLSTGYAHIGDSQCGFTAIDARTLAILGPSMYARYGYPNDLLVRLRLAGVRVEDVPVRPIYGRERSKLRIPRVAPRIAGLLARGFWLCRAARGGPRIQPSPVPASPAAPSWTGEPALEARSCASSH